jgi:hypothetical protein
MHTYQALPSFSFSSSYDRTYDFKLTNTGYSITGKYNRNDSSPFRLINNERLFNYPLFEIFFFANNVKFFEEYHFLFNIQYLFKLTLVVFDQLIIFTIIIN